MNAWTYAGSGGHHATDWYRCSKCGDQIPFSPHETPHSGTPCPTCEENKKRKDKK